MNSLLEDLYWGKVAPADKGCLNNPKLIEQMNIAVDTEKNLLEPLEAEKKDLFEAFSESQNKIQSMTNLERYLDGFRMGMRLTMEALFSDK